MKMSPACVRVTSYVYPGFGPAQYTGWWTFDGSAASSCADAAWAGARTACVEPPLPRSASHVIKPAATARATAAPSRTCGRRVSRRISRFISPAIGSLCCRLPLLAVRVVREVVDGDDAVRVHGRVREEVLVVVIIPDQAAVLA